MAQFIPTIGVETHVQLKTATKLFSGVGNDAKEAEPNSLISHIDAGFPGALPVLNEKALELAVRAAFALHTTPQKFSHFDRKHYFYPDLPKGYQITQYQQPIILGGHVEIEPGKKIGITQVHLEEDAGKNMHPAGSDYSLVDLNRAGTPLLEIVSEPDIHSASEAKAYARELWLIMKYAGVTDGDLYHGHVRFDINVSVSNDGKLGARTEVKNLNSFRSVENAAAYEIKRQIEILEKGDLIIQETRGWDEAKGKTTAQRSKEEAEDYRYMPEPDIPPIELDDNYVQEIKAEMPESPARLRQDLKKSGLAEDQIEIIIDNYELAQNFILASQTAQNEVVAKAWSQGVANNKKIRTKLEKGIDPTRLKNSLAAAAATVSGKLNSNQFSKSLEEIIISGKEFSELAHEQISDETMIQEVASKVIDENPKVVADIKAGKTEAIGFLVGQVMAKTKGQANPQIAKNLIEQKLK